MTKFSDYLKNIFWLLIILQLAPAFIKNIKTQYEPYLEKKTKVGVICIKGPICNSSKYIKDIKQFFERDDIKAIVLKIDSPGGAAGASQAIFNEIKELKKGIHSKFVLVLVENIAASGGYYIASAADYIVATPAAFIGSIGSYISYPVVKEFIEYHKFKYEIIKSGSFKTVCSPFVEITSEQRAFLQNLSDNVYHQFIKDIKNQRAKANLPADIKEWAEGKIFTGEQALKIGLIDSVGSQTTAVEVLKAKAPIIGKIEWVKPTHKTGILQTLFSGEDESDTESTLESSLKTVCSVFEQRYGNTSANF